MINNGGQMSKHIYMGGQRILSKLCDAGSMPDPTKDTTACAKSFTAKYADLTARVKTRYDSLGVVYNGKDNAGIGFYKAATGNTAPSLYYYHSDHLGSASLITDGAGHLNQHLAYMPNGEVFINQRATTFDSRYKFSGKEMDEETGLYYFSQRYLDPKYVVFTGSDQLREKYPNMGSYVYCADNPLKFVDPDGRAWKPTKNQNTGEQTGYQWIPENQSHNKDGSLKTGLYAQAIFFSENGTYDSNSNRNLGSSTAYVYLADGTTTTFDACTHPSDPDNAATVPAGLFEAKVGTHTGKTSSYTALRMSDVGTTNFYESRIELGVENPAYDDGRTYASGVNTHKAGKNEGTGSPGSIVSSGCFLISKNDWDNFIGIFNTSSQRNNVISVTMSRTMAQPTNTNVMLRVPMGSIPSELMQRPDATRVAIPYRR